MLKVRRCICRASEFDGSETLILTCWVWWTANVFSSSCSTKCWKSGEAWLHESGGGSNGSHHQSGKRTSRHLVAVDACRQAVKQCGCLLSQLSIMSALTLEQEHNLHCTFVCSAQQVIAGFLGLSVDLSAHCLSVCTSVSISLSCHAAFLCTDHAFWHSSRACRSMKHPGRLCDYKRKTKENALINSAMSNYIRASKTVNTPHSCSGPAMVLRHRLTWQGCRLCSEYFIDKMVE